MEDYDAEGLFTLPLLIGSSENDSGLRVVDGDDIIQKALLVYQNTSLLNRENGQSQPLILCEVDETNDESNLDTSSQLSQDEQLENTTETLSLSDGTTCSLSFTSPSLSDSLIIRSDSMRNTYSERNVQSLRQSNMRSKSQTVSSMRSESTVSNSQISKLVSERQMNSVSDQIDEQLRSVVDLMNDDVPTVVVPEKKKRRPKTKTKKRSDPKSKPLPDVDPEPQITPDLDHQIPSPQYISVAEGERFPPDYQSVSEAENLPMEPKKAEIDLSDLDTFIETVLLYKCRLCQHSSQDKNDITSHLRTFHLIKNTQEDEEMVVLEDTGPVECSSDKATSGTSCVDDIKREKSEDETQTLYMCGQCSLPFETMSECKAHMSSHLKNGAKVKKGSTIVHITVKPESELILPDSTVISGDTLASDAYAVISGDMASDAVISGDVDDCDDVYRGEVASNGDDMGYHEDLVTEGKDCPDLTKQLNFRCTIANCNKEFSTHEFMQLHTECHTALVSSVQPNNPPSDASSTDTTFMCCKCHHDFRKWSEVALHLWKSHHIDLDLFKCSVCTFKTVQKFQLRRHFKNHAIGDHFCTHCGKSFIYLEDYHNHCLQVHKINLASLKKKKLKRIECEECGASLSSSKALKKHIKIVHGKLRPYICTICSYASSTLDTLKLHLRQHTGETPFSCEHCNFKTRDHNTLRRHRIRHTFVKPYTCKHCPFSSVQATQLKNHILKFHPDSTEVYKCTECNFSTLSQSLITSHRKVHHRERRCSREADRDRNLSSMFPSSKKSKTEVEIMDEDSSSQCYYDSAHLMVNDTGGITIPASIHSVEEDMKCETGPEAGNNATMVDILHSNGNASFTDSFQAKYEHL